MGWFSFIKGFERRTNSGELESAINRVLTAQAVADGGGSKPFISEEGSLNLSAVWACVRILSETVGTLPIHLYKRSEGGRTREYEHPCYLLLKQPNSYCSRFDLMHHLMVSVALWGNGYARIFRDKLHRPSHLKLLHPSSIEPIYDINTDRLYYRLDNGEVISNEEVIHLKNLSTNSYKGKSPIAVHRDNLSLTLSAQEYGEKFFNQGGNRRQAECRVKFT